MEKTKKRLILIDSNALIHRAYHSLPPLSKKDGTLTNAVYGYALTLLSVLDKFKPDYIAATFDLAGPTFRHEQYEAYKATRKKAPDELYAQIPLVKDLVRAFNIPIYELKGFEADDVIGTIAKSPKINGEIEKIIVTGDLDTLQLVDENNKVFTLRRGLTDTVIYDIEKVKERYALEPWQMVEYKALRGDQSDNIPGVKGIGEKTAIELLLKYKDVEGVYKNLELISSASVKKKLTEGRESALMSKQLAQIDVNVPIDFDLEKCQRHHYDKDQLLAFLKEMEFYSLAKRIAGDKDQGTKNKEQRTEIKNQKAIRQLADKNANQKSKNAKSDKQIKILVAKKDVEKLIDDIKQQKKFAFWFLASSEKYYQAEVEGMGISLMAGDGVELRSYFVRAEFLALFSDIFVDQQILKIGYNVKLAIELLSKAAGSIVPIEPHGSASKAGQKGSGKMPEPATDGSNDIINNFFDVQIAAYLLRSGLDTDLERLILEEFGAELEHKVLRKGQASLLPDSEDLKDQECAERAYWPNFLL